MAVQEKERKPQKLDATTSNPESPRMKSPLVLDDVCASLVALVNFQEFQFKLDSRASRYARRDATSTVCLRNRCIRLDDLEFVERILTFSEELVMRTCWPTVIFGST